MAKIDDFKAELAALVDEYIEEVEDEIEDGIDFEIDHLEEQVEMLNRSYDQWRQLFADIFNLPVCMIENVEDARRWARKG